MVNPNYNAKGMFYRSLTIMICLQLISREFDPRSDQYLLILFFFFPLLFPPFVSHFRFSLCLRSNFMLLLVYIAISSPIIISIARKQNKRRLRRLF